MNICGFPYSLYFILIAQTVKISTLSLYELCMCAYQGVRNVRGFLENLACFLQISVLGFVVLPYYQRIYETNLTNIDPAKVTRATFGSPIPYSF